MRTTTRPRTAVFGLLAGSILILAGCSGTTTSGSTDASTSQSAAGGYAATSPSPAATSDTSAPPVAAGMTVTATETEFAIALSQTTFAPGTYTFKVVNQGKFSHNLTITGPGVSKVASPTLPAGQSGTVTATLQAGTYELTCSVPGHKDKGMDLKITVS